MGGQQARQAGGQGRRVGAQGTTALLLQQEHPPWQAEPSAGTSELSTATRRLRGEAVGRLRPGEVAAAEAAAGAGDARLRRERWVW